MSRATLVYILVVLASIAGVAVILERGTLLNAPPDLSGEWHVLGDSAALGRTMRVEQSGRFLRLSFERPLRIDVKLVSQLPGRDESTTRRAVQTEFKGGGWTLTTLGVGAAGPFVCTLSGPERHTFTVTRASAEADALVHASPAPITTQPAGAAVTADADTDAP